MFKESSELIVGELVGKTLWFWLMGLLGCICNYKRLIVFTASLIPFIVVVNKNMHNVKISAITFLIPCIVLRLIGEEFYNRGEADVKKSK